MEDSSEWIKYDLLDFEDPKYNQYNIDTRDFHAGYRLIDKSKFGNISTMKPKVLETFIIDKDTLESLLFRYFYESGGEREWAFFKLGDQGQEWEFKYLRIFKIAEDKFVVGDSSFRLINKTVLNKRASSEH